MLQYSLDIPFLCSHPVLHNPESRRPIAVNHHQQATPLNGQTANHYQPTPPLYDKPPRHPQPRQAWRNVDSPISDYVHQPRGKPPLPPLSSKIGDSTFRPTPVPPESSLGSESHRSYMSKKEEKLTEEW